MARESDGAAGDPPDRALRGDVVRLRKRVRDAEAAGDTGCVHSLEAAPCHPGRCAVAAGATRRDAEAEGDGPGTRAGFRGAPRSAACARKSVEGSASSTSRSRQPGGSFAIASSQAATRLRSGSSPATGCVRVSGARANVDKAEVPPHALPVEASEEVPQPRRRRPVPRDLEAQLPLHATGPQRAENGGSSADRFLVLDREREPDLLPVVRKAGLDLHPLVERFHGGSAY